MKKTFPRPAIRSRGSALLIVLAFLLLLTTLTVAFLARATLERQFSNASLGQNKTDLVAQGAVATVIADLQQEIVAGSNVNAGTTIPDVTQGGTISGYYYPTAPAAGTLSPIVPYTVGFTHATPPTLDGLENLVKISYPSPFFSGSNYAATGPNRASSISTTTPSLNGRSVTPARWNKPLLIPKNSATSTTDLTPVSAFVAPDWIYVARDGSNPKAWDPSYALIATIPPATAPATGTAGKDPVTERYAYAIYDEGSTLDMNVAGCPMPSSGTYTTLADYKNSLAYADLTQLPFLSTTAQTVAGGTGTSTTLTTAAQKLFINAVVGWRNNASALVTGTFPGTASPYVFGKVAGVYSFDLNNLFNANGFMSAAGTALSSGPNLQYNPNQTDNAFSSRQDLIQFITGGLGQNSTFVASVSLATLQNVLPFLGTFSRDINQPSYAPDPTRPVVVATASGGNDMAGQAYTAAGQNLINPTFLNVTAKSAFIRNDGTTAVVGEPLVKKRFALNRICWLTYKGPSADRTWPLSGTASATTDPDHDLYLLVNTYGIPASFLQEGTDANIAEYFGLAWLGPNSNNLYSSAGTTSDSSTSIGIGDSTQKWKYVHGAQVTTANELSGYTVAGTASFSPGRINTLSQVAALGRDPDFFELLKAAVTVGAIAKPGTTSGTYYGSAATPDGYSNRKDSSVDASILQLGANIIDQTKVDNFCTRIIFDDGTTFPLPQEYRGIKDLPYIYRMRSTGIKAADSIPAEPANSGTAPNTLQVGGSTSVTTLTNYGSGVYMEVPEIWNPNSWNPNTTVSSGISPLKGSANTKEFQCIMLSTDPGGTSLGATSGLPYSLNNGLPTQTTDVITDSNLPGNFTFTTASHPAITFTIPSTRPDFFREPTLLNKPDSGAAPGPPVGSSVASSIGALSSYYKSAAYTGTSPNSASWSAATSYDNQKYIGFNLAPMPGGSTMKLTPLGSGSSVYPIYFYDASATAAGTPDPGNIEVSDIGFSGNTNFTYRLQYLDPLGSGNYITYDEKFLPLAFPENSCDTNDNTFLAGAANSTPWSANSLYYGFDSVSCEDYYVVPDPRSNRWVGVDPTTNTTGTVVTSTYAIRDASGAYMPPPGNASTTNGKYWMSWVDAAQNAVMSARPDYTIGWAVANPPSTLGFYNTVRSPTSTGTQSGADTTFTNYSIAMGMFSQNTVANYSANYSNLFATSSQGTANTTTAQYYTDPDGVVRRGTAGYSTAQSAASPPTPYGLPSATATTYTTSTSVTPSTTQNGNHAIILGRPFRTVAELGYTYSGTPWRNIDFATPESGYAALLDVFCINDTNDPNGLVAGKVNLNTRSAPVLNAILAGAYKDEYSSYFGTSTTITSAQATALVTDASNGLLTRTSSTTSPKGPLANVSELVGKWITSSSTTAPVTGISVYTGFSGDLSSIASVKSSSPPMDVVQRFHESSIRALSAASTTRVWNLMIDVIAQTGRFPASTSSLVNFNVEGERRYWVHVAIDRYTGKVLDQQVEEVKE